MLDIHLLGEFRLVHDGIPITGINTPRLQSLFAYLVLHCSAPLLRQHLAFVLWPDATESQARNNLRQMLHQLRHALPDAEPFLRADVNNVHWRPDSSFTLDVTDFDSAVTVACEAEQLHDRTAVRHALQQAADLYRGELLASCYDDWIAPERERLRRQCAQVFEHLLRLLEEEREYVASTRYAERLLRLDPLEEQGYLRLMRLHALNNDRASALAVYHDCVSALQRELGVGPGREIQGAYARLLRTDAGGQPALKPANAPAFVVVSPLVGRQAEWKRLLEVWRTATDGRVQITLITGEAGIGKSRLAEELLNWVSQQGFAVARTRAYGAEGLLSYAPVTEWLRSEAIRPTLANLDKVWLTEIAHLAPELLTAFPELPQPQPLAEYWQRQRLFEALARAILAANQPLLLLIDDLQWCDHETLEWLHFLLRFDTHARLLVAGTARSEEIDAQHPLTSLLLALRKAGQVTEIALDPLDAEETARLAANIVGPKLDSDRAARLFRETEGNPLFIVEMVRAMGGDWELETRDWKSQSHVSSVGSPIPNPQFLPPQVYAVISSRLAQLSPPARELASFAATIGRAFTFDVLAKASDFDDDRLVRALDELWQRRIVRILSNLPGPRFLASPYKTADTYDFSHDKLRDVAYSEIGPARRRQLHRRVVQALELVHGSDLDPVSAQLAAHCEQGGLLEEALGYYERAAAAAQRVYANEDTINLTSRALALLERLPDRSRRTARELGLELTAAASVRQIEGWAAPELGHVLGRAHSLCQRLDDRAQLYRVRFGLQTFHLVRGELDRAQESAEQLLAMAQQLETPTHLLIACNALAVTNSFLSRHRLAQEQFEQCAGLYDPQKHEELIAFFGLDFGVWSFAMAAHNVWRLGYPDQALSMGQRALDLARQPAHPLGQALAMANLTMLHQVRRDMKAMYSLVEEARAFSAEYRMLYYQAWINILLNWALSLEAARCRWNPTAAPGSEQLTGYWGSFEIALLPVAAG